MNDVGNAHAPAKEAADVIVSSNDEHGVAEAIEKFVLEPRGLKLRCTTAANVIGA